MTKTTEMRLARIQLTLIDVLLDCMNMKTNPVDMRKKLGDVRDEVDAVVAEMRKHEEAKAEVSRQHYERSKAAQCDHPYLKRCKELVEEGLLDE